MKKLQLIGMIAEKANVTNIESKKVLDALISTITEQVQEGNKIVVTGLGSFEKVTRSARTGINPSTKEKIEIAAKDVPKFKAAKQFKDLIAQN